MKKLISILLLIAFVSGALLRSQEAATSSTTQPSKKRPVSHDDDNESEGTQEALTKKSRLSTFLPIPMLVESSGIAPEGKIEGNTLHLNVEALEPISGESFVDLIDASLKENKPFIVAVTTTKANGIYTYRIYDAKGAIQWFYWENPENEDSSEDNAERSFDLKAFLSNPFIRNRYTTAPDEFPQDPNNRQQLINEVKFFILRAHDKPFEYIGSDYDLFQGTEQQKKELALILRAYLGAVDAMVELILLYNEQNKLDLAEQYLKQAAGQGNVTAMNNLGNLYNKQNKLDLAEQYYKKAADQGFVIAMYNLGFLYRNQNKLDLAEQYYKQAADQGYVMAMNNLGNLYLRQNKLNLAEQYYKKAADQGYVPAISNLGAVYEKQNKLDLAEQYCKQAADQGYVPAINNLGCLYETQNKLELAEQYLKQAADQGDVPAMNNLGLVYLRQNKLDLAEQYFKQAAEKGDVSAMIALAKLYNKQNKLDLAAQYLKQALELLKANPNPDVEARVQSALANIEKRKKSTPKTNQPAA